LDGQAVGGSVKQFGSEKITSQCHEHYNREQLDIQRHTRGGKKKKVKRGLRLMVKSLFTSGRKS